MKTTIPQTSCGTISITFISKVKQGTRTKHERVKCKMIWNGNGSNISAGKRAITVNSAKQGMGDGAARWGRNGWAAGRMMEGGLVYYCFF